MLEVDECLGHGQRFDGLRPAFDVGLLVAFVAKAEVGVVGRNFHRRGHLLAVGHAKRDVAGSQGVEGPGVEPRLVPELERRARMLGQQVDELAKDVGVLLEVRRKLKEQDGQFGAERFRGPAEGLQRVFAALKLGVVRDASRRLEREGEAVRRSCCPSGEQLLGRHPVEGVIDFNRGKALGVIGQHLVGAELLGIEGSAPFGIVVAAGADGNALCHAEECSLQ